MENPKDGLSRWLNAKCRCFGDKGDVEDITEGMDITSVAQKRGANSVSRHHLHRRIRSYRELPRNWRQRGTGGIV